MAFKINNINIKNPSTFKMEHYNITTMERIASGRMAGDLIAKKKKFYFTYDSITGAELETILSAIDTTVLFFAIEYDYNGETKTAQVYVGSIPYNLRRAGSNSSNWVWKNLSFNLIEQ